MLGVPVAWMISSNGKEVTIYFFLKTFHARNPTVPRCILSDRDDAQLNALQRVFPSSRLFLCLWHVLHAWRRYLRTQDHPEVWKLCQQLPRAETKEKFDEIWILIKMKAPRDFVQYLETNWMAGK
jgi:MULE transposase domain